MNAVPLAHSSHRAVVLVGAGVVGQAILKAHLDRGLPVILADQSTDALDRARASLATDRTNLGIERAAAIGGVLPALSFTPSGSTPVSGKPAIVIESIAERLDVKQTFLLQAESWFGDDAILCSNTSTIRLASMGQSLRHPERLCGMHFFMPVDRRQAVEVIRAPASTTATIEAVVDHVHRLGKQPVIVADAPGFVVNRMLAPYLNQAMTMLCGGVSGDRIEAAAIAFGMPMSPLELIDWIGTRTTFDAGRVYWQSFPARINPSPLIAALVKRQRAGRVEHGGFYDYADGTRSVNIADEVLALAEKYYRELPTFSDDELAQLLAIPMWIEARKILAENVVASPKDIEIAMSGGLGYRPHGEWFEYFQVLGNERIEQAIRQWSPVFSSMIP